MSCGTPRLFDETLEHILMDLRLDCYNEAASV